MFITWSDTVNVLVLEAEKASETLNQITNTKAVAAAAGSAENSNIFKQHLRVHRTRQQKAVTSSHWNAAQLPSDSQVHSLSAAVHLQAQFLYWTLHYNTSCNTKIEILPNGQYYSMVCFIKCVNEQYTLTQVDKNKSVSQWNAWPATGHSAVQDLRSCAILQASLAFSRVSSSICCTHVRQGRPCWHFHSGLMSGLPAVRASTARRSAEWAGVASGSRRTWPKMEIRLRQIRLAKPSSPVWLVTEAFVTKWNQRIPKIRRWQFTRGALLIAVHRPSGESMSPSHITVRRWQWHCKAVSSSVNTLQSAKYAAKGAVVVQMGTVMWSQVYVSCHDPE